MKTRKMEDSLACVDNTFNVRGVQKLRVADLSVMPSVPNCRPTSVGSATTEHQVDEC